MPTAAPTGKVQVTTCPAAVQLAPAGVYVAMHNQVLRFPGVVKDTKAQRFVRVDTGGPGAP